MKMENSVTVLIWQHYGNRQQETLLEYIALLQLKDRETGTADFRDKST